MVGNSRRKRTSGSRIVFGKRDFMKMRDERTRECRFFRGVIAPSAPTMRIQEQGKRVNGD